MKVRHKSLLGVSVAIREANASVRQISTGSVREKPEDVNGAEDSRNKTYDEGYGQKYDAKHLGYKVVYVLFKKMIKGFSRSPEFVKLKR